MSLRTLRSRKSSPPANSFRSPRRSHAASGNGWKSLTVAVYTPSGWNITTRLYFFAEKLFTDIILKMLEAQSGEVDRGLAGLEVDQAAIPDGQTFNRLSLDLHIRQLGSILDWLIECHQAFEIKV